MTDTAALVRECTARIMDRIEMCSLARTAILSDDIAMEVERTLGEFLRQWKGARAELAEITQTDTNDEPGWITIYPAKPSITHYDDATAEFVYSDGRRVSMLHLMSKGYHAG